MNGAPVTEDTEAVATDEEQYPWQRLSPMMLAVHPVQEVLRFLPVLLGVLFLGRDGTGPLWSLIGLGLAVGLGLIRWLTTTYQITPRHVRVRRGLLNRQLLSVPRDRVRSVDLTAHLLQRVLRLSRVVIGTGRSDRSNEGVTLDALSTADGERLRTELLYPSKRSAAEAGIPPVADTSDIVDEVPTVDSPAESAGPEQEIATLNPRWVRFGPFTMTGLATVGVLIGSLTQFLNESNLEPDKFGAMRAIMAHLSSVPTLVGVLEVGLASAIVVAVLSTFGYVFAFWGFRLTKHRADGTLHIERGLVTKRSTSIELARLRGVELSEPLLLRAVKGARCIAITTGLRVGHGAEHGGSLLLPPAPLAEVERVGGEVYGDHGPMTAPLERHGPRARTRRYTRALTGAAVITGALLALWWLADWPSWMWQVSLALFPLGLLAARDRYRNLGHTLHGRSMVIGQGSLVRKRHVLAPEGVIGWIMHESFFQRRAGLITLTATMAAGKQFYNTADLPSGAAVSLADRVLPGLLMPFLVDADGNPVQQTEPAVPGREGEDA